MKENGKVSFIYSWPIIILALYLFWPVGILLIIRRVSIDKKFALSVGKLIEITSVCSYVIAALVLLACLSDGFMSGDMEIILFFGIAGFVLHKLARRIKNDADSVKQYLAIIVNEDVRRIDSIATATGKSYDVVKKDLQKMIQKGYLKNACIDESTREIILPTIKYAEVVPMNYATTTTVTKPVSRIVSCPCCGANNIVVGVARECEYCGSPLQ